MPDEPSPADARLAELRLDEALRTLAGVRRELTDALREHRANEQHLAARVVEVETELEQARDTIRHMERSVFWRLRKLLRGGRF
jgi:hypothetical protein